LTNNILTLTHLIIYYYYYYYYYYYIYIYICVCVCVCVCVCAWPIIANNYLLSHRSLTLSGSYFEVRGVSKNLEILLLEFLCDDDYVMILNWVFTKVIVMLVLLSWTSYWSKLIYEASVLSLELSRKVLH